MISRRRILSIIAGSALLPLIGAKAIAKTKSWNGIALGANAQIIIDHENADELISLALLEIKRLEKIFSLYDKNSEISKLNKNGILKNPSFEFLELLSITKQINLRTNGAFDPTIQPLWALYAKSYAGGDAPSKSEIARAKNIIGFRSLSYSASEISFAKQGAALSLNGIAQGFIADKVSELFKRKGVSNVLINTGEIMALGQSPQGNDWQVKIAHSDEMITLNNMAIATSAPLGTAFDKNAKVSHIFNPNTGLPTLKKRQISVIAESATIADGLSTGFSLMNKKDILVAKGEEKVIFF